MASFSAQAGRLSEWGTFEPTVSAAPPFTQRHNSLGSMNECCAISDLPASTPSMKLTSHCGENDGDEPGIDGEDGACRRRALENGVTPQVAGDSRRARPAGPTAPAGTPPGVVQISSNLSERMFLGALYARA